MPDNGGWCPWGRLDNPHDDALTIAGLTESDVHIFQGMISSSSLSVLVVYPVAAVCFAASRGCMERECRSDGYGQTCQAGCAGTIESGNRQF